MMPNKAFSRQTAFLSAMADARPGHGARPLGAARRSLAAVCSVALLLAACNGNVRPENEAEAPAVRVQTPDPVLDYDNNIYFNPREALIDAQGRATLAALADNLKANPGWQVVLTGHSDFLGSRAYDLAISEKRVEAVYETLRAAGVPRKQIRRVPLGVEKADPACTSEICQQARRRVELLYVRPQPKRNRPVTK